ncbi:MAG: thiazole synthase [Pseudomonadota bacterium]
MPNNDKFTIANRTFKSRLMIGTGKFGSHEILRQSIENAKVEIVTVALRRVDLTRPEENVLSFIDRSRFTLLPNTSGARDANEAVTLAKIARDAGLGDWVKLEVTPEPRFLLPDPVETFRAAEILVKDGFKVLPYMNADPLLALKLQDVGCATVMPLGSPIGSNRGINTRESIKIIIEQACVPVVVDAGLGMPSHAAEAMEMGADAVLVNTAIAEATNPTAMACAFAKAVEAGREAYLAGRAFARDEASASSPTSSYGVRRIAYRAD